MMRRISIVILFLFFNLINAFHLFGHHAIFSKLSSSFHRLFLKPQTFLNINSYHKINYKSIGLQCTSGIIISDETYEEWLDDIIYSGDIEGYIKRKSHDLVNDDFLDFLEERIELCQDSDEKNVLTEVINAIQYRISKSDGLLDSDLVYERRLDRILFASPQKRRDLITDTVDDMTTGFISYIQDELKAADDTDVKVVLASVLQLIGQVKNVDLLSEVSGISNLKLSSVIDTELSGALDLTGNIEGAAKEVSTTAVKKNSQEAFYEQILAGLVFSKNDVLEDVLNNVSFHSNYFLSRFLISLVI